MWKTAYRVAVLTASDLGAASKREDESGPLICRFVEEAGGQIACTALLADDREGLECKIAAWCDDGVADLVLTTGGTGLSPRDEMPEATCAVANRMVPGIAEALRAFSMQKTPRAMFGRGVAVVRGQTLIINLPGSPKAVRECLEFLLPNLEHGLDILCQNDKECGV